MQEQFVEIPLWLGSNGELRGRRKLGSDESEEVRVWQTPTGEYEALVETLGPGRITLRKEDQSCAWFPFWEGCRDGCRVTIYQNMWRTRENRAPYAFACLDLRKPTEGVEDLL